MGTLEHFERANVRQYNLRSIPFWSCRTPVRKQRASRSSWCLEWLYWHRAAEKTTAARRSLPNSCSGGLNSSWVRWSQPRHVWDRKDGRQCHRCLQTSNDLQLPRCLWTWSQRSRGGCHFSYWRRKRIDQLLILHHRNFVRSPRQQNPRLHWLKHHRCQKLPNFDWPEASCSLPSGCRGFWNLWHVQA